MKALTFKEKQDVLEDLFKKYHHTGSVRLVAQWNRFLAVRLRRKIYQS